jgi:hypothetical protein
LFDMQKQLFLELAYKVRSKLLRQMDALKEKLEDLTPNVKLKAMDKQVENSIRQKAVEHDLFLEKVTSRYGIKMSEWWRLHILRRVAPC